MNDVFESLKGRRVLLTGAGGMLGQHLSQALSLAGAELYCGDLSELGGRIPVGAEKILLDITSAGDVARVISDIHPDWVINAAAYTAVDDAERNINLAFEVNAYGPGYLARAVRDLGARMVHISSDYVYGADDAHLESRLHYIEGDLCSPCGIYGQSKRAGDELVISALPHSGIIVRTSWLHGIYGPNFVDTIVRVASEREEIRVVNDQFGSPTWAGWLTKMILCLMQTDASGVVHASSQGEISWYDFAKEIVRLAGLSTRVLPQTTAELGRPAKRPAFSVMNKARLEQLTGETIPDWRSSVAEHFAAKGKLSKDMSETVSAKQE
ncbi:MAG: dTDP-4-dehydrorhamnose reductase [bacterium]|nr:dTDP-4-dehydrorhamnose reductase [bacterium]